MTTNQPTIEERLSRLETLFVNVGEKVAEHDGNIDVLVANIHQINEETTRNINKLAEEAALDRQQAAQDRQQAALDRQQLSNSINQLSNSVNQILNYLRDRNGGSPPPQI
ncbi:MAG: hypothetical protein SAK29_26285 [Scytonema sp. PMC 1069.18]|nr:hypothetical protein [Scytonema sp. PMC 1069.18]MEC4887821.1 hypothetical protein [Scytonema sp. PMC 1070.18]